MRAHARKLLWMKKIWTLKFLIIHRVSKVDIAFAYTPVHSNVGSIPSFESCPIFLRNYQSIPLPLHIACSFLFLTCYVQLLGRVPIASAFFCGLDGSDLSLLWTLWLKICFVENAEDVVGVASEVDIAVLTCNALTSFLENGFPWHK